MTLEEMAARINNLEENLADSKLMRRVNLVISVLILLGIILTLLAMWRMPSAPVPQQMPSVSGNSVTIGSAGEKPQRDWLTSAEVAKREGVAARTVLFWIDRGEITPAPVKNESGDWRIAANYRRLPQIAATESNQ